MTSNLLNDFSNLSDELFALEIIRTDSFTGEIGEYFVSKALQLKKTERSSKAIDGIDSKGLKYQIKAKVVNNDNFNYPISNLKPKLFDFLVIIYFDEKFNPIKIYKVKSSILKTKISFSQKFINQYNLTELDINLFKIEKILQDKINLFGTYIVKMKEENIIKTRHIVGDLGEFYAVQKLELDLCNNTTQKGFDAIDKKGLTYEIKTRRVYLSERRKGNTRRLNNLVGKNADFLIVVTLDKYFECNGMWKMPLKNVINPKSAHLGIVKSTKDTEIIIPTNISWLK